MKTVSSELCIWKTVNELAMLTCKKKGLKIRDRMDRVKVKASIYFYVSIF